MHYFDDYLFDCEKAYIEKLSNEEFKALFFNKREHFERLVELVHTQTLIRGSKAETREDKDFFRYPNKVVAGVLFGSSLEAVKHYFKRKRKIYEK